MPWQLTDYRPRQTYVKLKLCSYGKGAKRRYLSKLGVPYILSSFVMRDKQRLALCLHGGSGDMVSAVFPGDYDRDAIAILKAFIKTADITYLVPLTDRLMELEHWIAVLLMKWMKCANTPNEYGQIDCTPQDRKIKQPVQFNDLLSV